MAGNYPHQGYPPPFFPGHQQQQQQQQQQQPPPGLNQDPYANQTYPQNPPQYQQQYPAIPGMDMATPVLDQNQLAYFWQQLASGNPALPANVPLPQTSPVQPAPFSYPQYAPPPIPIPQQVQPAPTQSSPVLESNIQHSRVNELGRSDREDGELSEEGEVSTPESRGPKWKNGRRVKDIREKYAKGKSNQGM
jgi:hypothetical protein